MSINTTTLSAMSSQIIFFKEQGKELNQADIQSKEQTLDLITDVFFDLGGATALLKAETKQLISSNITLIHQLNQLKLEHTVEISSLVNNQQLKLNLTAKRIESLIEGVQLNKYDNKFIVCETAISLLIKLQQDISEQSKKLLGDYPEEDYTKEENDKNHVHPVHFLQSENFPIIIRDPILNEKFRKLNEELQSLKNEIYPLRQAHDNLIKAQKNRIFCHQKDLEKAKQECKESLTKLFDSVSNTEKNIFSETLFTINTSLIRWNILSDKQGSYFKNQLDKEAFKINEEFRVTMETIVSSIFDEKIIFKDFNS